MVLAVAFGTLLDAWHKGSAKFFSQRRRNAVAAAKRRLDGAQTISLAARTIGEAAVSGEFL